VRRIALHTETIFTSLGTVAPSSIITVPERKIGRGPPGVGKGFIGWLVTEFVPVVVVVVVTPVEVVVVVVVVPPDVVVLC
jgi:hypothetical protein